jgi:hypothetical protein
VHATFHVIEIMKKCDPGPCVSGKNGIAGGSCNSLILRRVSNFDQFSVVKIWILNLGSLLHALDPDSQSRMALCMDHNHDVKIHPAQFEAFPQKTCSEEDER